MTWRLAKSLVQLREQVNQRFPSRSKIADGTIGDQAHQARGSASDHNPHVRIREGGREIGIVTAIDLTHSPLHGMDTYAMAEHLRVQRDNRVKYAISERRIFSSSTSPWIWRTYSGTPHTGHIHISVLATQARFDDPRDWNIDWGERPYVADEAERATIRRGSTGDDVRTLQRLLAPIEASQGRALAVDGVFGLVTEAAVRRFQAAEGIGVDSIVGPQTWERLELLETIQDSG